VLKIFSYSFTSYLGLNYCTAQVYCSPQILHSWKLTHCKT